MGIINEIQDRAGDAADAAGDAVDEAVDTVEEAAENPKETAEEAADAAGDAVNEAVETVEEAAGGNQDKNKGSDGGNQDQTSESGGSAGFTATPEQVTDTFTGPSESEQADRVDDAIDQEDAQDADIANDNIDPGAENPRFLETGAEQTLSKANRQDSKKPSDKAAEIKTQGFTAAQNRADRAEEAAETIQRQKQKVDSSRAAEFEFTKGGETETVSKQEAVNRLEQQRQQLEQNREKIQSNQLERLDNLRELNEQSTTFTPEKAAERFDVSRRGVSVTFLGRDTGVDLEGNAAEAFTFADTTISGGAQSERARNSGHDSGGRRGFPGRYASSTGSRSHQDSYSGTGRRHSTGRGRGSKTNPKVRVRGRERPGHEGRGNSNRDSGRVRRFQQRIPAVRQVVQA